MLLLTLRGTPTMYQGDELGMENVHVPTDKLVDPPGIEISPSESRDPERTPMQWDASPNAGFTAAKEPWLPVAENFKSQNVEAERNDPDSVLSLYKALIELRRMEPALAVGSYTPIPADSDLLTYIRQHEQSRMLVALNLGGSPCAFSLPRGLTGTVVLGTHRDRKDDTVSGKVELRGNEGLIARLG
jgi:alpha-glucosidase